MNLEPRSDERFTFLYEELNEFLEIYFIMKGCYSVGFSINRKTFYPLQQMKGTVIGLYGVTFGKRSEYIYRSISSIEGYFVRKTKFLKIINDPDHKKFNTIVKVHIK